MPVFIKARKQKAMAADWAIRVADATPAISNGIINIRSKAMFKRVAIIIA
jgi:hypothetical protein